MKKTYTVAGIGACLGKIPGCEALAESVITGTPVSGKLREDSLALAVREALRFTCVQSMTVLTDTQVEHSAMSELNLGDQQLCGSFAQMLEKAPDNALLLSCLQQQVRGYGGKDSKNDNGRSGIHLAGQETGHRHK